MHRRPLIDTPTLRRLAPSGKLQPGRPATARRMGILPDGFTSSHHPDQNGWAFQVLPRVAREPPPRGMGDETQRGGRSRSMEV